jgi:hypothetical protein
MRWWCLAAIVVGGCGSSHSINGDAGEQAAIGAEFVLQRGCGRCHDSVAGTLAGNDVAVVDTAAFPANLTPDRTTGIGGWADEQIIRAFRYGIDNKDDELCPAMPRFSDIGDVEATAIVAYLRSLPPVMHEVTPSMCPPLKPLPSPDMAMPPTDM